MFSKMVLSGDKIEIYEYSRPILAGHTRQFDVIQKGEGGEDKRYDNLLRARQSLRRLIWSNKTDFMKFLTLTYRDTVLDVAKVQRDMSVFFKAMRRRGYSLDYVYVLEHQKERGFREGNAGCLHVHMILFNDGFINLSDLNACWPHGSTDIQKVRGVRDVGAYVSKYISKETFAEFGQHTYRTSLGLKHPEEVNFYIEDFADGFDTEKFHPHDVLRRFVPSYYNSSRRDYLDQNGVAQVQEVNYYQGVITDSLRRYIESHRLEVITDDEL